MNCDTKTKTIIERLGHDVPLIWEENQSKIIFTATVYEMLDALFDLNQVLALGGFVTLEDFIAKFDRGTVVLPKPFDLKMFGSGWSSVCFDCWDGLWLDIGYEAEEQNGRIIFSFYFIIPYCDACYDCDGCDRHKFYEAISQKYQAV